MEGMSEFKGVYHRERTARWEVWIKQGDAPFGAFPNSKQLFLGAYGCEIAAARNYDRAAIMLGHTEELNLPLEDYESEKPLWEKYDKTDFFRILRRMSRGTSSTSFVEAAILHKPAAEKKTSGHGTKRHLLLPSSNQSESLRDAKQIVITKATSNKAVVVQEEHKHAYRDLFGPVEDVENDVPATKKLKFSDLHELVNIFLEKLEMEK